MKIYNQIKLFVMVMETSAEFLLAFMFGDNQARKEIRALRLFLHGGRIF